MDDERPETTATLDVTEDLENTSNNHPIQNRYTFWFRGGTAAASKVTGAAYTESIRQIDSFQTVEHFWRIYDHLKRPSDFKYTTEYHLFKEGITPTWEDPQNKAGGKWMLRLKKGIASRYWEDILLAIIGEQFDVGSEVCGAVLSVRNHEDIISVWNKTADNTEAVNRIRDQIRKVTRIPPIIAIEYKRHQDSLQDKSSYRNPTMVWRASQRAEGGERGHRKDFNYNRHNHHNEEGNNNRRYNRNPTGGEEGYQPNSWKYTRGKSDESGNSSGYQPNRAWSSRGRSYSSGGDDANDSSNQPKERSGWQRGIGVNGESNAGHSANGGFRPSNKNATSGPSGTGSAKVSGTPAAVAPPVPSANKIPPPGNAWTRAKPSL